MHRPGPLAFKHIKGPGHQTGHFFRIRRGFRKGTKGARHSSLIRDFMQTANALAQRVPGIFAADDQQGHAVTERLTDRCGTICHPRAGDQETDARLARYPGIAIRHESGALLVPGQDMTDRTARKAPIQFQIMHAGNAKDRVDAVLFQQPYKRLSTCWSELHDTPRVIPCLFELIPYCGTLFGLIRIPNIRAPHYGLIVDLGFVVDFGK